MRREFISYKSNLPLTITYCSIKDYPMHWHNSFEIIYVVEGNITLTINTDQYEVNEKQLEIINMDEAHSITSNIDNKLLIFQFDPLFFKKYYADIDNVFFYVDSSTSYSQESDEYIELKTYLAKLLYEYVRKMENFDEEIEKLMIELLFHLINNFHYLLYEQEDFKENKEQLERYHRISKYIYNNYNNNITLQDIAKKEFLSPHYLSHEIKYATGSSFTDLINLTRVEESIKLLLDTDMSIADISEEVGFSHVRYYNKHFKNYYDCTPLQFKRKNKLTESEYNKKKEIPTFPLKDVLNDFFTFLKDYDRFNYENKIWNLQINMNNDLGKFDKKFRNIISLGDAFDLLIEDNKDILEELQNEIHFSYGRLEYLFSEDMGIFKDSSFFNWNRVKTVLEFLSYIELNPLIVIDNEKCSLEDYKKILKSFFSYFNSSEIIDINLIKFQLSSKLNKDLKEKLRILIEEEHNSIVLDSYFTQNRALNPLYDTSYMIPYIIHKELHTNEDLSFLRAFDVLERETYLNNEIFIGASGLINDMQIRKPSYYAYYLLNKLYNNIVAIDNGYIVTKDERGYAILLYNYDEILNNMLNKKSSFNNNKINKPTDKTISLNITNIKESSRIILYEINEKIGSSYDYWISMGKPDRLNKGEKEILSKASFPNIKFKFAKKSSIVNIICNLKGYGATLILIKPQKNMGLSHN